MANIPLGPKIKVLRRREGWTQKRLAEQLGVSPSYLNLIENGKRPLPANLLIKLASILSLDLTELAEDDDARLLSDIMEVLGDDLFEPFAIANSDVREFVSGLPGIAQAMNTLYDAYRHQLEKADALAEKLVETGLLAAEEGHGGLPSEEVSDMLQRHGNHYPELEAAAEALWRRAGLEVNALQYGLVNVLEDDLGVTVRFLHSGALPNATVRRYDPERRVLEISEVLPPRSRHFQLAHMIGLLTQHDLLDRLSSDPRLTSDDSRQLARVALANYFAGAVLMPYQPFLEAARSMRYDIELLGHRFRVSFEQVCHRLTTMQRAGATGVPFHLVRTDVAGNISKKFAASGIRFARYSGLCPKWNVFGALRSSGDIRVQVSEMPGGERYFSIARTLRKGEAGYHQSHALHIIELGCPVEYAPELVYSAGVDLDNADRAVPVGVTCRLCARPLCAERVMPSVEQGVSVDENLRALSFYAVPSED
ncbi:MAG: XRE family transcriptional regulator [Deltaproteobacteria bacterium]|nr:MAG: XRE family transcriptional regulator [Deltaproteobacteria bacterium]